MNLTRGAQVPQDTVCRFPRENVPRNTGRPTPLLRFGRALLALGVPHPEKRLAFEVVVFARDGVRLLPLLVGQAFMLGRVDIPLHKIGGGLHADAQCRAQGKLVRARGCGPLLQPRCRPSLHRAPAGRIGKAYLPSFCQTIW